MIGFPFDSHVTYDEYGAPVYDRAIASAPYRSLLHKLFNDGVMPNPSTNMQVTAGDGMTVVIQPGFAIVQGCMKLSESTQTLSLEPADAIKRIDAVVLRLNTNDDVRSLEYAVIKGTPATTPIAPAPVRAGSIYDIVLAHVTIVANSSVLSDSNIADTRYDTEICGILSSISEFDTTTLYDQIQSDLNDFKTEYEAEMTTWTEAEMADFLAWYETVKDILDESVAGNLQNEIDDLSDRIDNLKTGGSNIKATFPEDYAGQMATLTTPTDTYSAKIENDNTVEFNGILEIGSMTVSAGEATVTFNVDCYSWYEITVSEQPENEPIQIISAPCDTVYCLEDGSQRTICVTDENGVGLGLVDFSNGDVTLYSTIAKATSNVNTAYSQVVKQTEVTENKIYLMPEGALYWYGWKKYEWGSGKFCISGMTNIIANLTHNTNNVSAVANCGNYQCKSDGFDEALEVSKYTTLKDVHNGSIETAQISDTSAPLYLGFGVAYGAGSKHSYMVQLVTDISFMAGTNVKASTGNITTSGSTHIWSAIWLE